MLNTRGDSRGCPPWVHLFGLDPKAWREAGIGGHQRMNKGTHRREVSRLVLLSQDGLPRVGRSPEQTVWPRVAVRGPSEDHVLGPLFLHHG